MVEYLNSADGSRTDSAAGWLSDVRNLELERIVEFLPPAARVLDFGSGAGYQALRLRELGFTVDAVDLEVPPRAVKPVFAVRSYDGRVLPFPDAHFDAVMSSNVLEHVRELPLTLSELARVLKPGGVGLHVMPSSTWRLWTTLAEFIAAPRNMLRALTSKPYGQWAGLTRWQWVVAWSVRPLLFRPHGEYSCALWELWTFSRRAWLRRFSASSFDVARVVPLRLWYTGEILLGPRISMAWRTRLASWLGSSTILYIIRSGRERTSV
jgi:SAM-dependent methyltransferase